MILALCTTSGLSGFGTLCLRPSPSLPLRTSDAHKTLGDIAIVVVGA
ncbi:MAG: hypothetical protein N2V76_02500 [Methanophagales archaeon]|nr:hypothetical protein [Methanophagales archaeon]